MGAGTAKYQVRRDGARLITARVSRLLTRADADAYSAALADVVRECAGHERPILCADHRPVAVYPQPATDRLVELFQQMNGRLARVAILVAPTNATLFLQLSRLVREASFEDRRVFQRPDGALAHLEGELSADDLARARAFLAQHSDGGGSR